MRRRTFLRAAAVGAGALLLTPIESALGAPPGSPAPTYAEQAESTYKSMQSTFYASSYSLYREDTSGSGWYAFCWPMSRASSGTIDLTLISKSFATKYRAAVNDRMAGTSRYWDGAGHTSYVAPPLGWGGDRYYDDNNWMGMNLARAHASTRDSGYLARARETFAFVASGWDSARGGVYWKEQTATEANRDRGTVSNGGAAVLAMQLFIATGEVAYRDWAVRLVGWVDATLRDPADGLYWDNIKGDGSIDYTKWSYNQGLMALAGKLLADYPKGATYDAAAYADRAATIINSALGFYNGGWEGQGAAFNAVFFRAAHYIARANATLLTKVQAAARGYASAMWTSPRRRNGVWYDDGGVARLIESGAMVELFSILAMPSSAYPRLV
jgi:hypothetical protein